MNRTVQIEALSPYPPHRIVHPVMRQVWRDLTFLHWPYQPSLIQRLLPPGLALDLHDGAAWIGLVPFVIDGLTLPHAPAAPWISSFPETNVRTYVIDDRGLRGVWFFSLDAARLLAVIGARVFFALPYFWAAMRVARQGDQVRYTSRRWLGTGSNLDRTASDITIGIGEPLTAASELEIFLTARFRLYAYRAGRLIHADVEHPPWPLQRASVLRMSQTLVEAAGISAPLSEPLVHFADRVEVLVGGPGT